MVNQEQVDALRFQQECTAILAKRNYAHDTITHLQLQIRGLDIKIAELREKCKHGIVIPNTVNPEAALPGTPNVCLICGKELPPTAMSARTTDLVGELLHGAGLPT